MAPTLDDLISDTRLARLFQLEVRHCVLQLWVLQLKVEDLTESRIIYGRLLPYNFSNGSWSASEDDNFNDVGEVKAQIVKLNLYVQSATCAELLRKLSAGRTIAETSDDLGLILSAQLRTRFGGTALPSKTLVYRPVAYLLNRDALDHEGISSPHGGSGAFSAAISRSDKDALFLLGEAYHPALTAMVVKGLDAATGLAFGQADAARFGDIELLVFPALDDEERALLNVIWQNNMSAVVARFNPAQLPDFAGFYFHLSIANAGAIAHAAIQLATREADGSFTCAFSVSDGVRPRSDSAELEIFGIVEGQADSVLCCRWRGYYIREVSLRGQVVGGRGGAVKFYWLEKATRPSLAGRVKSALTMGQGGPAFENLIGDRQADPWVPAERHLTSLFTRLYPQKSEGEFFLRKSDGDGAGRLEFVEWFKALLAKYHQNQIVIFDPYFEDVGLGLLLLCASANADTLIFTALPKPPKESKAASDGTEPATSSRIDNLLANCKVNEGLLRRLKLRIFGLKEGRLHDRYILSMGADGLPAAGFNLSNSFQKAAENYPLLITPIPADTLLKVERYKSDLVREAQALMTAEEVENPPMRLLFDSTVKAAVPRRYEPLPFLGKEHAGNALALWTGDSSLVNLRGDALKEQLETLGIARDHALDLPPDGLSNCVDAGVVGRADFSSLWDVLGDVLASSTRSDDRFEELANAHDLHAFLQQFLATSFLRRPDGSEPEFAVIKAELFRNSIDAMLRTPYVHGHFFHATKYAAVTWAELFAIKFLWDFAPGALVSLAEREMPFVLAEPQAEGAIRLSLLSQIVSEIALSIEFGLSDGQRDILTASSSGLLQWLGFNAIEQAAQKPGGAARALHLISRWPAPTRIRVLGWMINHAGRKADGSASMLITALHDTLSPTILGADLKQAVDAMRGHMRQLSWAEPWLFQDVIEPLLKAGRASFDDAWAIWRDELAAMLEPLHQAEHIFFDGTRDGRTTAIAAYLYVNSSAASRKASLQTLSRILKRQQRIIQQPLASTSNWSQWNAALVVSMWLLAFTQWAAIHLAQSAGTDTGLDMLAEESRKLAMVRSMTEWTGRPGELGAFLLEAERLLSLPKFQDGSTP